MAAGEQRTRRGPAAAAREEARMEGPVVDVVVAESEPEVARSVAEVLRADGYGVAEAKCGEDAVRLALALRPAVLVLSEEQPDIPSREVFRRLEEAMGEGRPAGVLLHYMRGRADGIWPELYGARQYVLKLPPPDWGERRYRSDRHRYLWGLLLASVRGLVAEREQSAWPRADPDGGRPGRAQR